MKRRNIIILSCLFSVSPCFAEPITPVESDGPVFEVTQGIAQPESAYYDKLSDFIYISNIAGSPGEKDGRGWIQKVRPNGTVVSPQWVTGLNAPKGIRVFDGKLFVADIDDVVVIDVVKGSVVQRIHVPNALMLNDVVFDERGNAYISDTIGSAIYKITSKGEVNLFAKGDVLESPNGLLMGKGKLYVAAWGLASPDWSTKTPGRLFSIDLKTKAIDFVTKEPLGNLDGLEMDSDGNFLVSDSAAGKIFRVFSKTGKARVLFFGFKGSADIGYIPKMNLLLVPRMGEDEISAYDMSKYQRQFAEEGVHVASKK